MKLLTKPRAALRDALQQLKQRMRAANRHRLYRRRMKKGVDYATWIAHQDTPNEQDRLAWRSWVEGHPDAPLVDLILNVEADSDPQLMRRSIDSIRSQAYPHWRLTVAVPAQSPAWRKSMPSTLIAQDTAEDTRIVVLPADTSTPTQDRRAQAALLQSSGTWVGLLDVGDELREHALLLMAQAALAQPDACVIYPDDDHITSQGRRTAHHFKPDWNHDFLLSANYIGHACLILKSRLLAVGGYQSSKPTAYAFDALLRCTDGLGTAQIAHVPRVLWHHPGATQAPAHRDADGAVNVLQRHLDRTAPGARATTTPQGLLTVRYPVPMPAPLVSIVICTRNQYKLLRTCVQSITEKTSYGPYEIIIVDNGSDDEQTLQYLKQLPQDDQRVRVIRDDSPFNYAALNNMAVDHARGELVALLNNDIEVIAADWLSEMVGHALRPEVGCVGAKLLYPDETVQHAGVLVGSGSDAPGAIAAHYQRAIPREAPGYANRAIATQQLTAVTAACLVIRKSTFVQVGGLDSVHLAVTYNDVDFCLRVAELGLHNIWTPHALLYHHESISRGRDASSKNIARFLPEQAYMQKRWAARLQEDPHYNVNLSHEKPDFLLSIPVQAAPAP